MSQLNSEYVVKYYNSWTEGIFINKQLNTFIYIQMQLCSQNLMTLIKNMNNLSEGMFKYFIQTKIFVEIIECLKYLHSSKPPIIHRDLKPENILVLVINNSNRIIKLCDFGLSKIYENSQNSRGMGTKNYMAPEVFQKQFYDSTTDKSHYTLKSDIYGLGVIATKLFKLKESIPKIRKLNIQ